MYFHVPHYYIIHFSRLKDSDVTWLYGPLHTAVDWTPPPKPKPDPTSVDKDVPNSALDRLDLSTSAAARRASAAHETKHKSILKYRSISELLTSELPASIMGASPRFGMSPQESDGEVDPDDAQGVCELPTKVRPILTNHSAEPETAAAIANKVRYSCYYWIPWQTGLGRNGTTQRLSSQGRTNRSCATPNVSLNRSTL